MTGPRYPWQKRETHFTSGLPLRFEPLESRCLLTASVQVEIPDDLTVGPGETVTVPVWIDNAEGVRAAAIEIAYDTDLLDTTDSDVAAGSVWPAGTTASPIVDDGAGTIAVWVYGIEPLDAGAGSLLEIEFSVPEDVGEGRLDSTIETSLLLSEVVLNENEITAQTSDGLLTILCNVHSPVFTSPDSVDVPENTIDVLALSATDADLPEQTVSFATTGGVDQGLFEIVNGNELKFKTAPDYEIPGDFNGDREYLVEVTATDSGTPALSTPQIVKVTVTPENDNTPVFTSPDSVDVSENTKDVLTLAATDADLPAQTVSFAITGGADQDLFEVVNGNELKFKTAPDYEIPGDSNGDSEYLVEVTATDSGDPVLSTPQTVEVTVTPENDNVPVASTDSIAVAEGDTTTALVSGATTVLANDTDADLPGDTLTAVLDSGPTHASSFTLNSDGTFSYTHDGSENQSDSFTYHVNDGLHDSNPVAVSIDISPVNDNTPVFTSPDSVDVSENTKDVLTLAATDADLPAQTVSFAITGGVDRESFEILNGNELKFKTAPDYEIPGDFDQDNEYLVEVTATDSGAPPLSTPQIVKVTVTPVDEPPLLELLDDQEVAEETLLTFTASATDPDSPAGSWEFSLDNAPAGATIDADTGVFEWVPTEGQGPAEYQITIKVTDKSNGSLGDEQLIAVTVCEVSKIGEIDFHEMSGQQTAFPLYYRLETRHTAWLTVEGIGSSTHSGVEVELHGFDSQEPNRLVKLADSELDDSTQRIDWSADEGEVYHVRIPEGSDEFDVRFTNLVFYEEQDGTVNVYGTDANDIFEFRPGNSSAITINEVVYQLDGDALTSVAFDGGEATDTADLYDTDGDDLFVCRPSSAVFTNSQQDPDLRVDVTNAERIHAHGVNGGDDTAEFHDSEKNDKFIGRLADQYSKMRSVDFENQATSFGAVRAEFENGGHNDTAVLWDSNEKDEFRGSLGSSTLSSESGHQIDVTAVDFVFVRSTNGGDDELVLTDSSGDDMLLAEESQSRDVRPRDNGGSLQRCGQGIRGRDGKFGSGGARYRKAP